MTVDIERTHPVCAHFELFVFAGFPLTREQHAEVRAALAARRG